MIRHRSLLVGNLFISHDALHELRQGNANDQSSSSDLHTGDGVTHDEVEESRSADSEHCRSLLPTHEQTQASTYVVRSSSGFSVDMAIFVSGVNG